jgi:ABC-type transport system involved in cytochrome c biogenesis permease subunit
MLSGIHVFCFFATCAFVVLGLEVSRLFFRMPVRLIVMLGIAAVGFIAQTLYLSHRAWTATLPLSTWHDWFLVAAWILMAAYLGMIFSRPTTMVGVFLLPVVIGLILVAAGAPRAAWFQRDHAQFAWAIAHGVMLLLGTVTVSLGFVAGVMYLVQSWRLKHHVAPQAGLKLPSLEWLQAVNKQSLIFSSFFIALGLVAGIILNAIKARASGVALPWYDSVVISSAIRSSGC